ncbi:MAG: ethylbenzene dehydrogenase-related protein [bacterium]
MKRLLSILLILPLVLWTGCGDDNGTNGDDDDKIIRLVANTSVGSPDITIVDDPVWDSVATTTIAVSTTVAPKVRPPLALGVANSISLKAIKKNDSLFIQAVWSDDSLHLVKDAFAVFFDEGGGLQFTHQKDAYFEDQLMLMFTLPGSTWYDVWNWRSLQTAQGFLAEGANYYPAEIDDSLYWVIDDGNSKVYWVNQPIGESTTPTYLHKDGSGFHGQVMNNLDRMTYRYLSGWEDGQIIPGWSIDTSVAGIVATAPESRWDVTSAYAYDSDVDQFTVVLTRKLNTGSNDDLDLSTVGSVSMKVGVFNNQSALLLGGSQRGFTKEFLLVLP